MDQFTAKELAEKLGTTDTAAYGVIAFLESKSVISRSGERKRPDGKGKPSVLYAVIDAGAREKLLAAFGPLLDIAAR